MIPLKRRLFYLLSLGLLIQCFSPAFAERPYSNFEKAYIEIDDDHHKPAVALLKAAIAENPRDADAHSLLARVYMLLDQYGPSRQESTRAIELNPRLPEPYSYRGFSFFKMGQLESGLADLKKAIELYRANAEFTQYFDCKNLFEASRRLRRHEQMEFLRKRIATYELLRGAEKLREQGRLDEAMAKLNEAVVADPSVADLWLFRGVLNSNKREFWSAVSDFSQAIKLAPEVALLYYQRGDCYQQLGQHREALEDFSKVIQLRPRIVAYRFVCETGRLRDQLLRNDKVLISIADMHVLKAQSLASLNRPTEALAELDQAIAFHPQDSTALSRRAELKLHAGRFEKAINDYSRAISVNPEDWRPMKARADAYLHQGRLQEALQDLERIVRLNPSEPGAHMLKANALESAGRIEEAIEEYTQVVRLNPKDDDAYVERARCHERLGDEQKALDDYTTAERLNADNASVVRSGRAKIYQNAGKTELAESELKALQNMETRRGTDRLKQQVTIGGLIVFLVSLTCLLGLKLFRKKR